MLKIKILLSLVLLSYSLFGQEDSTVYLKPSFQVGDQLQYKLKTSFVEEIDGRGSFLNDNYLIHLKLLKVAFRLGIFKANYNAIGSDYRPGSNMKLKDDLNVFFTIDSNTRFIAIENCFELIDSLNQRSFDGTKMNRDSVDCVNFFPEIELLFLLQGAKYVKGEVYRGKTFVPTKYGVLKCMITFEMIEYDRKADRFRIVSQIVPESTPKEMSNFDYNMAFEFRLSDLVLLKIDSKMVYESEGYLVQKSVDLSSN